MKSDWLRYADEVAEALAAGRPVVALESTIVAHGMPYPENLATAQTVEDLIRAAGAVPATIAVMDGAIRIGLSAAELQQLAQAGAAAMKQVTGKSMQELQTMSDEELEAFAKEMEAKYGGE